jgi:phenylalanyl-tRNA synthetase beta chain
MKISLNWLSDYVDLSDVSPERVAELLSLHTAEVEGIEVFGEAILDVVIGQVIECGQHPDADKLSVTQVEYGAEAPAQVVCGASNVRKGLKIAFAPVGCRLPGDFKIKKAKLRGVESRGMICSERELELSDEHAGILELADDAPVGQRLVDVLGMLDHVLELDNKSLTHRPDLWGHYGFARELAAILKRELKPLPVLEDLPAVPAPAAAQSDGNLSIQIDDPQSCAYYAALKVQLDGPPKAAPDWMQQRLIAVGQRPIDDLVDLSNYILLDIGQPTHAFDFERIHGAHIQVRRALELEPLRTLDDQNRQLNAEDLVIADADRAIALAGVMGGADAEVGPQTEHILLESASFHATRVRRTAHRLALRTEASSRFEKSLDPGFALLAIRRFAYLLQQIRPAAQCTQKAVFAGVDQLPEIKLSLNPARTAELLGLPLTAAAMQDHLTRLGFSVVQKADDFEVTVPSWRATKDVTTTIDLVEEVGRLTGYDQIAAVPLMAPVVVPRLDPIRMLTRRLSSRLVGAHHAYESQAYTFLHEDWASRMNLAESDFVQIDNPVQDGVRFLRRDPIPSLLDQVVGNRREFSNGILFEAAKGYTPTESGGLPEQHKWLGLVLWQPQNQAAMGPASLFGQARSLCQDLFRCAGLRKYSAQVAEPADLPAWAHPHRALSYKQGLGMVAVLHPELRTRLELEKSDVAVVMIDLEALQQIASRATVEFRAPSRFPAIKVDVALALPKSLPFAEVDSALRQAGGKILDDLQLFDLFEGGNLGPDQRSMAFHATLRVADRTLTDKDEQKFLTKVAKAAERIGGSLRS